MESLSSISFSLIVPSRNTLRHCCSRRTPFLSHHIRRRRRRYYSAPSLSSSFPLPCLREACPMRKRLIPVSCGGSDEIGDGTDDAERALQLGGEIPGNSGEFVKRVSSRAYDMRRNLHQTFDRSSYDVLEVNPWREMPKPVYILTHNENQLCTMKTRRNRSEVERELDVLFSKGAKRQPRVGGQTTSTKAASKFQMLVEDIREGVLVFEDELEAAKYCDLMQGRDQGCEGIAEMEASYVFDLCRKMRAPAVLFRRGRTPPRPESLQLNLRARTRSLEDQEELP